MIKRFIKPFLKKDVFKGYDPNDVFLITYPKSGTTWLRFLIANSIKIHYGIRRNVNFFSIQDIIPGIPYKNYAPQNTPFGLQEIPRIYATHSSFNPYYKRIIFQVRDPRDVMVSYYLYLQNNGSISSDCSISEFIRDKRYGIDAWNRHTRSWLKKSGPKDGMSRIVFSKYEDLLEKPTSVVAEITDAIGLSLSQNELKKAVELSSKDNMKKTEKAHLVTHLLGNRKKTDFVRKGSHEKGSSILSKADLHFIKSVAGKTMNSLNYAD